MKIIFFKYGTVREDTKMSEIQAVIFDLDGTLLNTLTDLADAVNYALKKNGLPLRTKDEVRQFVGNGVEKLMIRAIADGKDHPLFEKIFIDFKEYYGRHCNDHTLPYEGILELMQELENRNLKMAIVSNKIDSAVKELNKLYFCRYTKAAIGECEGVKRKPAPDTVLKALKELQVEANQAIYVGDSDVDIQTAANAGLVCVSVTWGFRDKDFLQQYGAKHLIDKPCELLEFI